MRHLLLLWFCFTGIGASGQVDITKYANQDLFEIKPVISESLLNQVEYQEFESQFEYQFNLATSLIEKNEPLEALAILRGLTTEVRTRFALYTGLYLLLD